MCHVCVCEEEYICALFDDFAFVLHMYVTGEMWRMSQTTVLDSEYSM